MSNIEWSKAIKDRDGKCMHCGSIEDLHAHHIKPKSTHPELKLEISNGITLCYRCHKREHETNRTPRIRNRGEPQRRTLLKKIEQLERMLELQIKESDRKIDYLLDVLEKRLNETKVYDMERKLRDKRNQAQSSAYKI